MSLASFFRHTRKPLTIFLLAQSSFVRCVSEQSCPVPVRSTASSGSQVYESSRAVSEYLLFHYGDDRDMMPYDFGPKDALGFTQRLADLGKTHSSRHGRALDIGCSVGGAAFHLSKHFDDVVGIDFSNHFVDAANIMKSDGRMSYQIMEQGQLFSSRDARLPVGARPERVRFEQGDATNMKSSLGKFDLILASNLLCRLPSPRAFLESVPQFLNPGGTLLLVSPYSWLDEYTPANEWMGAKDGKRSYEEIRRYISERGLPLVQTHREDIPFLIREHERKFQYGVSDAVVFTRS